MGDQLVCHRCQQDKQCVAASATPHACSRSANYAHGSRVNKNLIAEIVLELILAKRQALLWFPGVEVVGCLQATPPNAKKLSAILVMFVVEDFQFTVFLHMEVVILHQTFCWIDQAPAQHHIVKSDVNR